MKKIHLKKQLLKCFCSLPVLIVSIAGAQTVSTIDDPGLILQPDTSWNGSDLSGGFASGSAFFVNEYDTAWDSWTGFAYSDMRDTITAGNNNQYSAFTGTGYNNSANYAIANAYSSAKIRLAAGLQGTTISGFYVTNTTYTALSMRNGDVFAKKFGGNSGNDPDWFMLSITAYSGGALKNDTVGFYLADYRSDINSEDYILNTWEWVDLTVLGNIDSLSFALSSSDTSTWGMNTPSYFALDNFNGTSNVRIEENAIQNIFTVYPNPADQILNISLNHLKEETSIRITDLSGKTIYNKSVNSTNNIQIPIEELAKGFYTICLQSEEGGSYQKFIKR